MKAFVAWSGWLIIPYFGASLIADGTRNQRWLDAEAQQGPMQSQKDEKQIWHWWWGPDREEMVISAGGTTERDPNGEIVRGIRLSAGTWYPEEMGVRAFWWASGAQGDRQKVFRVGLDAGGFMAPLGPLRVFPHFKLGVEHRRLSPHEGLSALAGIGLEAALMLGKHVQVAATVDRNFGFPSGTRNEAAIELRWGFLTKSERMVKAAEEGNVDEAKALLDKGASPNANTDTGSVFYAAASRCDAGFLELLLNRGADPRNISVELALRTAVRTCPPAVAGLLLDKGADPNANYYFGGTILMEAVKAGKTEVVGLLLAHGADANGKGRYAPAPKKARPEREEYRVKERECEGTALMLAAKLDHLEIARLLIDHGADVRFIDPFGCTALRNAERGGHTQVAEFLRSRGATE